VTVVTVAVMIVPLVTVAVMIVLVLMVAARVPAMLVSLVMLGPRPALVGVPPRARHLQAS